MLGTVSPGFEPLRAQFARSLPELGRGGGAFAAYADGTLVADLWAGAATPGSPWGEDTIVPVASATKGLAGFCIHMLVDRGLLDPDAPVSEYWPEYATAGKETTLVRHILIHSAGLVGAPALTAMLGWDGAGWDDWDAIVEVLAAAPPSWRPGTRHGYHALTWGWLAGELVRRVSGRSIGTFFATEVAEPLGLDARIGTPSSEHGRVAYVHPMDLSGLPPEIMAVHDALQAWARRPDTLVGLAFLGDGKSCLLDHVEEFANSRRALAAEIPASNGTTTARSMAKVYALLANGGTFDGVRLVSPESVRACSTEVIKAPDVLMADPDVPGHEIALAQPVSRTLVYYRNPIGTSELPRFGPSPDAYGAEGLGGQVSFCDAERGVAAAFVRSQLGLTQVVSDRLVETLYHCLEEAR